MGKYLIKDFEAISGIKAHTIRIWEQRYGILKPERSQTNIRQYNDEELRLLLNLSMLNRNGFKISNLAKMGRAEIEDKVRSITATNLGYQNQIDALTLSMVRLDEAHMEKVVNINIANLGFEVAMEQIVFPFLRVVGVMWQTGSIHTAQEHFISNLIRQKLIVAIDRAELPQTAPMAKSMLFLPEPELHELGLLYLSYLLRKNHHHVMYLGQNVPFGDMEKARDIFGPDYVFTIFTSYPMRHHLPNYVAKLSKAFSKTRVYVSGYMLMHHKVKLPSNIYLVNELSEFRTIIQEQLGYKAGYHKP